MKTVLRNLVSPFMGMPSPVAEALQKFGPLPLHPKVKYRIGRIGDMVEQEMRNFERSRLANIRDMGEPVELVQPPAAEDGTPQPPDYVVVTDPVKLKHPEMLQYRVKAERQADFEKAMNDLLDSEVEFKWDAIPISQLANSKGEPVDIPFDLSKVMWMFTDE